MFSQRWQRCVADHDCDTSRPGLYVSMGPGEPAWGVHGFGVDAQGRFWVVNGVADRLTAFDATGKVVAEVSARGIANTARHIDLLDDAAHVHFTGGTSETTTRVFDLEGDAHHDVLGPERDVLLRKLAKGRRVHCAEGQPARFDQGERVLLMPQCAQRITPLADGGTDYHGAQRVWRVNARGELLGSFTKLASSWPEVGNLQADTATSTQGDVFQLVMHERQFEVVRLPFESVSDAWASAIARIAGRDLQLVAESLPDFARPFDIRMRFDRDELTFRGGCNGHVGRFSIDGGRLKLASLGGTEKSCPRSGSGQVDTWLSGILEGGPELLFVQDEVHLRYGSEPRTLRMRPAPPARER